MREPIWLSVARSFIGLKEVPGAASNPVILQWANDINAPAWYDDDSDPWCAVFVNRILLACQLPMSGRGFDLLRAKSFETWGEALPAPALGAILVFSRPEGAHVGLYLGERHDAYRVLGGNQSNAVGETWIAKTRLTAIRWPSSVPLPVGGRIHLKADGSPLSTNEA
jgi:uncharacterized protein (TIGR02594 family)